MSGFAAMVSSPPARIMLFLLLVLFPAAAQAKLIIVPGDHPSITEAISAAESGDTILVEPGIYREFIDFKGKSITVASLLFTGVDPNAVDRTVLAAPRPGLPVVSFTSNEGRKAILYGFSIRGGASADGGGILCHGASPTILHNRITGNRASNRGGGVCLLASRAAMRHNRLEGNRAVDGGGLYVGAGSEARIHFNQFSDNQADRAGGAILLEGEQMAYARGNDLVGNRAVRGGGLAVTGGARFLFHRNLAGGNSAARGGGIYAAAADKAYISANTIRGNEAVDGGGCLFTTAGDVPVGGLIRDNRIHGNLASARGGGLAILGAHPVVLGNSLVLNSALAEGGGLFCSAGRFFDRRYPPVILRDNLLAGNMGEGAAVCDAPGRIRAEGNKLMHNQGGGLVNCGPENSPDDEPREPAAPIDST